MKVSSYSVDTAMGGKKPPKKSGRTKPPGRPNIATASTKKVVVKK